MRSVSLVEVHAEMVGSVVSVVRAVGDRVAEAETVLFVESMKMEIPISAEAAAVIVDLPVVIGTVVQPGDVLAVFESGPGA